MAKGSKIHQLIPKIMAAIGEIAKNGNNEQDGYAFARIEDVLRALNPLLIKHKVFFIPSVVETFEEKLDRKIRVRLKVKYVICADDGSQFESIMDGEAIDQSDKATNKALTAAFKKLILQVFAIVVKDQPDGDFTSPKLDFVKGKPSTKTHKVNGGDLEIADGKYKGKMASSIPKNELEAYVLSLDQVVKTSGRKHPSWFVELQKWVR